MCLFVRFKIFLNLNILNLKYLHFSVRYHKYKYLQIDILFL